MFAVKTKAKTEQEANQKQEYKFFGTFILKTGCKLFSYLKEDGLKEVVVKIKTTASYLGGAADNNRAQYNPEKIYFQAINEKNAKRKLEKYLAGDYNQAEQFKKQEFLKINS